MKRILLFLSLMFITLGVFAQYVDLGLPSGTKWKKSNEPGFYTYEEALSKFGNQLPTAIQLDELIEFSTWEWLGNGYKVIGPSGEFIYLPATGYNGTNGVDVKPAGNYWSATEMGSYTAYNLFFTSDGVNMLDYFRDGGLSVRLVQD